MKLWSGRPWTDPAAVVRSLLIVLSVGAFLPLLRGGEQGADGDLVKQVLWIGGLLAYSVMALFSWRDKDFTVLLFRGGGLLWIPVLLAWLSALWSVNPGITLRRSAALSVTIIVAVFLYYSVPPRLLLRSLSHVLSISILVSLFLAVVAPDLVAIYDLRGYNLSGVFVHKNEFGFAGVLLVCLGVSGVAKYRVQAVIYTAIGTAAVVLSNSSGALVGLVLVIFGRIVLSSRRLPDLARASLAAGLLALVGGLAAAFAWRLPVVLEFLGRDPTLTGRTDLWGFFWKAAAARPLSGYGYGAFFERSEEGGATLDLLLTAATLIGQVPSHAHSGVLTLAIDLGIIGAGVVVVYALRSLVNSLIDWWMNPVNVLPENNFYVLSLTVILSLAVVESTLLPRNSIYTFILIWAGSDSALRSDT